MSKEKHTEIQVFCGLSWRNLERIPFVWASFNTSCLREHLRKVTCQELCQDN